MKKGEQPDEDNPEHQSFSQIRNYELDPEAVTSRGLRDALADLGVKAGRNPLKLLVVMLVAIRHTSTAIFELEKQIIALRREIRGRQETDSAAR
ncbi:hypothetical protein A5707_20570 [Mycobacterium kyorinense]|uniref:Uncharacterized protein n=1 Tax=Mycobacterium kyorinense TaxID=487514 RepID=A0A1A2Z8W6_9MYCO|nr:hypothetical protein [Mycobacterium kyorinense]OBI47069.1 hypothetical protein A5707_20570 [Mycobacterium kyorinense]